LELYRGQRADVRHEKILLTRDCSRKGPTNAAETYREPAKRRESE
jgi:hypothetical protein